MRSIPRTPCGAISASGSRACRSPLNLGNLFRTAHAFGASFTFSVAADVELRDVARADTSMSWKQLPYYRLASMAEMELPKGCRIVGVELVDGAVELPSFRHPARAAYVFGRERGSLSDAMQERCEFLVQIPTRFCLNVGIAGAIVLYDRLVSRGRFAERGVRAGGPAPSSNHGPQKMRRRAG
jgi:tRNA G18 (ribose-2'-O)-methylase SpoU